MLNDIFVCGSSVASGYGRGKIDRTTRAYNKSWVHYLAEISSAKTVWNSSFSSKPIGLATGEIAEFTRQYGDRYKSYKDLFVIAEYTLPQYRHWDPVATSRTDTQQEIEVIPISFFRAGENLDHVTSTSFRDSGLQHIGKRFLVKNDVNILDEPHQLYTTMQFSNLDPKLVNDFTHKSREWLKYDQVDIETGERSLSEKKMASFLRYASDEITTTQNYLEHLNIPYLMFWAGGQSDNFCKKVDRYFAPLMANKRLIPMSTFTANKGAQEWSDDPIGVHPDEKGHRAISEYIYNWIVENNLQKNPNNTIFTGDYL